ncbi:SprT family zinc-dependent metalloprotease [Echinimonas agarilytica]|uniref:SprT family zinc-dependent metalloprotease n=1 Tax=Echinimonas agarilytica TaxID=1215918 RepID=A0AA41W882_9GAMM|nr:SprT family zinc-dependent metalloprotease [Echinimonas agarilytica]MCM2680069.1 SprT family zinc-dependent metalloprotease [Echinimonas agarilytica]
MAKSPQAMNFDRCRELAESHWRVPLEAKMQQLIERASRQFAHEFTTPELHFNQRGTCAGSARLNTQEMRLNPVLLEAQPDCFVSDIMPHELAHLLVHQYYGRVPPHGAQWQHMMAEVFGVKPARTHRLDVTDVQGQTFAYECGCQRHSLTIRRHNKIERGATYRCRKCGEALARAA